MASEFIDLSLLVGICENFDIYYSGYIQTHCQKNKKIKRADQILTEVYGTTLNRHKSQLFSHMSRCYWLRTMLLRHTVLIK